MGHFKDTHRPVIPYPFDAHAAYLARPQPGGPVCASLVSDAFTIKPKVAGPSLVLLPNTPQDIWVFHWYFWSQYVLHNVCRSICQPRQTESQVSACIYIVILCTHILLQVLFKSFLNIFFS